MSTALAKVDRSRRPAPGDLRPFSFPAFARLRLGNGLRVFAAQLAGFPLISLELINPAGGVFDPPGLAGLSSLTAAMVDEGTAGRNALEIAAAVERIGGYLATGVDWDGGYLAAGGLTAHVDPTLDLLAEVATEPTFPEAELERLRRQRLTEILRRGQVPANQADLCFQSTIYRETPYAWPLIGTQETVSALDRAAISSCYQRLYGPSGSTLLVVGDFEPATLLARIEARLGGTPSSHPPPDLPAIAPRPLAATTVYLIDRPGAVQTELQVGHLGVSRAHPDYAHLSVLNAILGGKFTSRINLNLRERHGYTYGANSRFYGRRGPGPFTVTTAVATASAGAAAREILFELRRIRDEEVSPRELEEARSYVVGIFPYTLQTIGDLTKRLETLALHDFADDYFERYLEQIRSVSNEQILSAAQRFLHPEQCAIVAVGPAEDLAAQFDGLGPIVRWQEASTAES